MPNNQKGGAPRGAEDYWAIVKRRFWWISIPFFLCWLAIWAVSWTLPPKYRSEALILVEQQKVPENYVTSNVTVDLQDRLQSMTQQILSRTRLQTTIDRFHLYPTHQGLTKIMGQKGDQIDQMRRDINIELVRSPERAGELSSFKIQYTAGSPELAQEVNSELTSLFIDENLKEQQQQSESTTAFLGSQLEDARAKLQEQESKVEAYKSAHFGDLPSQMQTNVQILAGLQAQLQSNQRDLVSAKQQKLYMESELQQLELQHASQSSGDSGLSSPDKIDDELAQLRQKLADARAKYTDDYPDVIVLRDMIADREEQKKQSQAELALNQKAERLPEASGSENQVLSANATPAMMQIESQLKSNQFEIDNLKKQVANVQEQISSYQGRLNLTPRTEQELAEVSRGYEESLINYNSLLQKQNQSQLATSLEQRQQGQQFRILDPPSLPAKATSPNHLKLSLVGLIVGAFVGLAFASLLEIVQVRVWQATDLDSLVPARVLVVLPHLSTPGENRRRWAVRVLQVVGTVAMVIAILVGNLYAFYRG